MSMTENLRQEVSIRPAGNCCDRLFMHFGYREHYGEHPAIAKAYASESIFKRARPHIYDNDLIAGSIRGLFSDTYEDYKFRKANFDFDSYGYLHFGINFDHCAPDYPTLLAKGLGDIAARIEISAAEHTSEKEQRFLHTMRIVLGGYRTMLAHYAEEAGRKAEAAPDEESRARFLTMQADLIHLQDQAPTNFRQALQLVFMTHVALTMEGRYAMALGRIDQYLHPFYERDVAAGTLDAEMATQMLTCVFLKIGERRYLGGDDVVNICIGGLRPDGTGGITDLTYCVLEAVHRANIPGPNLSARYYEGAPDRFLDECLKVIATGLGYPALMNDKANIPALARHGYSIEDARDYCFVGCIENFIPGKQVPWSDGRFDVPRAFETLLFHGRTLIDQNYYGIDTGDVENIHSMEEFMAVFHRHLEHAMAEYAANFTNANDRFNPDNYCQPFHSLFMEDCIGRARDIRDGGCKYPSVHGIGFMGIGTTADSLAAIEKWIFNEKKYTLRQLADAIEANYVGYEEMRADMLAAPKYGNDDDFVDKYAVWFVEEMDRLIAKYRTRDGGAFYSLIAANVSNIYAGEILAATPDGRLAREAISDAGSPMHGMDHEGFTAVVNSTSKPDYTLVSGGTVLNQKFTPGLLSDPENRHKVVAAIRVYFMKGGQEMQINAVSREMLKDAMEHPENYQNLIVRVSGFSAYYVHLAREVQLDILKRTEYETVAGA